MSTAAPGAPWSWLQLLLAVAAVRTCCAAAADAHDFSHLTANQHALPSPEARQAGSQAHATLLSLQTQWPAGYVALCAVAKDQRRDLRYWVEYWRSVSLRAPEGMGRSGG